MGVGGAKDVFDGVLKSMMLVQNVCSRGLDCV